MKLCCITIPIIVLIVLLTSIVAVAFMIAAIKLSGPISTSQMGVNDDTVFVASPHSPWHSEIALTECLQRGDYYHQSDISLVPMHDLVYHNRTDESTSRMFPQSRPSVTTGALEYFYLVENSKIDYQLCITNAGPKEVGSIYIFDDRDEYFTYQNQLNDPTQNAVFKQDFALPPNNQSVCIEFTYNVKKSSYYFLAASTPGNIYYNYSYSILTYFFNHSDYSLQCSVLGTTGCDLQLPFKSEDFAVLAYVHPLMDSEPFATHICVETHRSKRLTALIAVVGAVGGVTLLLLLLSMLLFILGRIYCRTVRSGYTAIN